MSLFSVLFSLGVANFVVRYNLNNDTSIKAERERIVRVYLNMGNGEISKQVSEFDGNSVVLKNYFSNLLDLFEFFINFSSSFWSEILNIVISVNSNDSL